MTHRSSPRSPRSATPDAPARASPAPADGGYWDPDYNPRADDPLAWENYLPGGSFYREGDPVPPTTAEMVARLMGDAADAGSGDGDGSACEEAPDAGGAGAPEGELAGWIPDQVRNDSEGEGSASGAGEGAEDGPASDAHHGSDAGAPDGHAPNDLATEAPASEDTPNSAPNFRMHDLPIFRPAVDVAALLSSLPLPPTLTSHPPRGREWDAARRVSFLQMLSATGSVAAAARSVGMSRSGAYRLRGRMTGSAFVRAWDMAAGHGFDALSHAALDRALNGVEVVHYYKGEQIGTSRRFDERLTIALLKGQVKLNRPGPHGPEPGEWELLLLSVADEAEDEADGIAAREAEEARAAAGDDGAEHKQAGDRNLDE